MEQAEFIALVEGVIGKIVMSIVDKPEQVEIVHSLGDRMVIFSVKCSDSDRGKVIGKEGRMAISLRNITNALSAKAKAKAIIEIEK